MAVLATVLWISAAVAAQTASASCGLDCIVPSPPADAVTVTGGCAGGDPCDPAPGSLLRPPTVSPNSGYGTEVAAWGAGTATANATCPPDASDWATNGTQGCSSSTPLDAVDDDTTDTTTEYQEEGPNSVLADYKPGTTDPMGVYAWADGKADVASGVVLDSDGSPAHGTVAFYLWPSDLRSDGTAADLPLLGTTGLDAVGGFSFEMLPTRLVESEASANGGTINLLMSVTTDQYTAVYNIARQTTVGQVAGNAVLLGPDGSNPGSYTLSLSPSAVGAVTAVTGAESAVPMRPSGSPYCYVYNLGSTSANTVVGERHAGANQTVSFSYGTSSHADSDISVAVSSNSDGPWSLDGEHHVGQATSVSSTLDPQSSVSGYVTGPFTYVKERIVCNGASARYMVRAKAWDGGLASGASISGVDGTRCEQARYRRKFYDPQTFSRSSERSTTWKGGASVYGATLHATSGYSSHVEERWHLGTGTFLCGNDAPISRSHRVFAGR